MGKITQTSSSYSKDPQVLGKKKPAKSKRFSFVSVIFATKPFYGSKILPEQL